MRLFICVAFAACLSMAFAGDVTFQYHPTIDVSCVISDIQPFTRIGKKYYMIGKSRVTWFDSLHLCRRFGGDLAIIESSEEIDAISSYLKNQGQNENNWFWTSGNDLVVNHKFSSATNGLPLPYTAWSAGQPDLPGVEHCVHLWLQGGEFRMNNRSCDEKAYYICQRPDNMRCQGTYRIDAN